jgi:hypothetical protein
VGKTSWRRSLKFSVKLRKAMLISVFESWPKRLQWTVLHERDCYLKSRQKYKTFL